MSMNYDPGFFEYSLQPQDTLWDLAEQYNISVEDILAVNTDLDPNSLYIGQVIYLPNDSEINAAQREYRPGRRPPYHRYRPYGCRRSYVVQPGDTLYRISYRFGIPIRTITDANPYINFGYPLQVGQFICLP